MPLSIYIAVCKHSMWSHVNRHQRDCLIRSLSFILQPDPWYQVTCDSKPLSLSGYCTWWVMWNLLGFYSSINVAVFCERHIGLCVVCFFKHTESERFCVRRINESTQVLNPHAVLFLNGPGFKSTLNTIWINSMFWITLFYTIHDLHCLSVNAATQVT